MPNETDRPSTYAPCHRLDVTVPLILHRGLDALGRRARHAGGGDDFCLALHETVQGRRHCVDALLRYNDGAVPVGVDEIAAPNFHAVNGYGYAVLDHAHIGVGWCDRTRKHLKAFRDGRKIAYRAVGHGTEAAQRLVHVGLHFAPEGAVTRGFDPCPELTRC